MKLKKAILVLMLLIFGLTLVACSTGLTDAQRAACKEADEYLEAIASLGRVHRNATEINGKMFYVINFYSDQTVTQGALMAFRDTVIPPLEKFLSGENMFVLMLIDDGKEQYWIVDSRVDGDLVDSFVQKELKKMKEE